MTPIGPTNDRAPLPPAATQDEPRAAGAFGIVLRARGGRPGTQSGLLAGAHLAADPLAPPSQADMFNAEGFFQGPTEMLAGGGPVATAGVAPSTQPDAMSASAVSAATPLTATAHPIVGGAATVALGQSGVSASDRAASLAPVMSRSFPAAPAHAGLPAATAPVHVAIGAVPVDLSSPADAGIGAGRRLFARAMAARGAAMATRVAVKAVEKGIQVSIHVEGLAPAERACLRDRVLALLSRHGMAAQLRFNGTPDNAPIQRAKGQ